MFSTGDRIRVIKYFHNADRNPVGHIGTVCGQDSYHSTPLYQVRLDTDPDFLYWLLLEDEIELTCIQLELNLWGGRVKSEYRKLTLNAGTKLPCHECHDKMAVVYRKLESVGRKTFKPRYLCEKCFNDNDIRK